MILNMDPNGLNKTKRIGVAITMYKEPDLIWKFADWTEKGMFEHNKVDVKRLTHWKSSIGNKSWNESVN